MFPHSEVVYYLMYLVGFAAMMLLNLKTCQAKKIARNTAVKITVVTYFAGVFGAMLMGDIFTRVRAAAGSPVESRVAIFGAVMFTPLILVLCFLLTKKDSRLYLDFLTPGIFIILTCAKLGCFLNGCCAGVECSFGIYNPQMETTVFPVQIFEVLTMLPVIAFSILFPVKVKRYVKGMNYPATAAIYCVIRFCWEFARYYDVPRLKNLFLGMSFWQCCCILVILASCISLAVLNSEKMREKDRAAHKQRQQYKKSHKNKK